MKTKLLRKNFRKYLLVFSSLLFFSAIPYYFTGTGLDNPEPMGSYLNSNFPSSLPQGLPYQPVFPNITFDSPLTFNEVPNGNKIVVGQRDGKIFWFDKNPSVSVKNSMLDLSEKVGVVWDGGFLGLTLHPQFGTLGKNYFYVWYTTEDANSNDFPNSYTTQSCDSEEYWGNFLVLARYEANPNTLSVQESSEQVLLKLRMYGTTHRGGGLLFGDDGFLYLTTGDQTAFKKSQDIVNNLDGGVLRLDVDQDNTKSHPPVRSMPDDHGFSDEISGNGYWIPNDNPFLSPTGENFEEYYSMGHRNPHRMSKDRATGELYVGEIGGGRHEEINIIKKGKNFGWPLYEGLYRSTFCVQNLYNNMSHEQPLVAFPRSEANAIIGGFVYRGNEIPELQGKYLCADYGSGEEIFTVDINTGAYEQYGNFTSTNIISFGEDKQGELYILKQGVSSLYKVTSKTTGFGNTPQLLSQTGAFTDLNSLTPTDGLIPYDLVESFWSDGALKKRWMAIPNNGSHNTAGEQIEYSDIDDWNFPVGSVLVKHFELPLNENNPTITKRLETRFSIKASDGNFYFVTYKWNDQQTDAELLTSGLDESINVVRADGSADTQTWSYPSTIDCVSCHNPTTGGTLGTRARYLNKDYTYPKTGRTANQLVTLSHLGILDQAVSDADTNTILTSKSIDDPTASVDDKARSYLDLNCAYCHRPGTGNRGDFDLRLNLDILQTGVLTANPYLPLGIPNEKIVDPGNVATSILYHRVNSTDPAIRMPPISKNEIDAKAVQLINNWINQLDPDPCSDRIIMETFNNVPGRTIAELKSNTNFPNTPSATNELTEFRIPINVGDDYGVRVKGLLKAPETGTYYFWVTGDDEVELNLSSDDNEGNRTRIAYHEDWSFDGEWNKYPTQKSAGIDLVAGQNYYIEALMNERGGGDNLSVGWRKPSNGNGTVPFQVIPCTVFDYFTGPPVVNVTDVNLSPNSATIVEGATQQLTATVSPMDADDTSVSWISSNSNIATVDTNGLVTALTEGTTNITVLTDDGNFTASSLITVERALVPVTGVSVNPNSTTVVEGVTRQLTATVNPADADDTSVVWSSSNVNIATVDTNGLVTAIAEGTSTITVTTNDGNFIATSLITVERALVPVTGVSLDPNSVTLVEGTSQQLIATVLPGNADDTSVVWGSSDTNVATVSTNGLVTGVSQGIVTISVTTNDGSFTATTQITVEAGSVAVTGVGIGPVSASLIAGDSQQLNATVSPSDASDRTVSWSSGDTSVATVNANGLVSAISEGTTTITVTTNDGSFTALSDIEVILDNPNSCTASGSVLMERYDDIGGSTISNLLNALNYPDSPSLSSELSLFETPTDVANNFGVRVSGYLCAPETGTYYFWIAANNHAELNLSTSTSESDKVKIANHESWALPREWGKYSSQKSEGIFLNQGESYYIEALMKEEAFGDNLAVGWRRPADGDGALPTEVIPGNVLSPIVREVVAVSGISLSPTNLILAQGGAASLSPTVSPSDASDRTVSWSSGDTSVATVDASGLVSAISEGTTTITVTTNDGSFTAVSDIEVILDNPNSCTASGSVLMERYDDIGGSTISNLLNALNYPDNPSLSSELSLFETPTDVANNFGVRVSGYLCAPETGTYYFWIAANNHAELNLSTSTSESDKVKIANHESWALPREWDKFGSQKSQGVFLNKGESYYIEALMKEEAFGDNLAVGWRRPADGDGALPTEVIPGNVLSPSLVNAATSLRISIETTLSLVLSPVPASDILNIQYLFVNDSDSPVELAILDNIGRQVISRTLTQDTFDGQIDVSQLPAGAYFLKLRKEDETLMKRFTVRQ